MRQKDPHTFSKRKENAHIPAPETDVSWNLRQLLLLLPIAAARLAAADPTLSTRPKLSAPSLVGQTSKLCRLTGSSTFGAPCGKASTALDADEAATTKYLSPRLQRALVERCAPVSPVTLQSTTGSEDGTRKLLVELSDGLAVEAVIIPMLGGKHSSLCVSSQVGCSRGCAFCSTGTMGLVRSLTTEEILAQVWLALRTVREVGLPQLVNVVFMG